MSEPNPRHKLARGVKNWLEIKEEEEVKMFRLIKTLNIRSLARITGI